MAGDSPGHIVYEDEHTLAFLDINPWTRGHTLVVPKRHADDWWDVSTEDARHVAAAAHEVGDLLRERLEPDGLNLLQATRAVAFQTVFHLHIHVVPRYEDDGIELAGLARDAGPRAVGDDQLASLARRIRGGQA